MPLTPLARALTSAIDKSVFLGVKTQDVIFIEPVVKKAAAKLVSNIRRRPKNYSIDLLPYSADLHNVVVDAGVQKDDPIFGICCHFTYRHILNLRKQGTLFTEAQPKPTTRTNGTRRKTTK